MTRSGGGTIEPEPWTAARPSPRTLSRIGGALYLTIIAIGAFGELGIRGRVVVPGDAPATAANLSSLESLWRVGLVGELLLLVCATALAAIFYVLIRPVSRDGALLALSFNLVSLAVEGAMALYLAAALFPLTREEYRSAFGPEQLAALSLSSIQSHAYCFGLGVSNGGHMIYRLALEAPDLVRAVAAVAANLPAAGNMDCTPVRGRTSVLIMNGTADPINPYDGGNVTLFGFGNRGRVVSARASAEYFARRNGITEPPTTEALAQPEGSATSAERTVWSSAAGAEVRLYTIRNGGHTIPQPHARSPRILGRTHTALDGPAEIWRFFARQAVS